jgi:hypothetical protein
MKNMHGRIERGEYAAIANHAPGTLLFLVVDQMTMDGVVNMRTKVEYDHGQENPSGRLFVLLLVEMNAFEDGQCSIKCHARVEPTIHIQKADKHEIYRDTLEQEK